MDKKCIARWDEAEIASHHLESLKIEINSDKETWLADCPQWFDEKGELIEDELISYILSDDDLLAFAWQDFIADFQAILDKRFKRAKLAAFSFDLGWRKRFGYRYLADAMSASEIISCITPKSDFSMCVFLEKSASYGIHLRCVVYHHDSPSGETVYITRQQYLKLLL